MNDIINRAKRLFENRYHDEPWLALLDSSQERFWIETDNFTEVCGDFVSEDDTRLAAAAPELAQALAEETWEYGVEYEYLTNRGSEWRLDPSARWHKTYRDAEHSVRTSVQFRIVRRRVSPPEVIDV